MIETISRPYYDDTVQQWIEHVNTLQTGGYPDLERHECGFCQYVREKSNADNRCDDCPAVYVCIRGKEYWIRFYQAIESEEREEALEVALSVLEWLHDFEQTGKVTEVI